jgi:hypothetical protein
MASTRPGHANIRERAYRIWDEEGRPEGRDTEFWMRAEAASTGSSQLKTLTEPPPDQAETGKTASAKTKEK